jgi:hypothetical protein
MLANTLEASIATGALRLLVQTWDGRRAVRLIGVGVMTARMRVAVTLYTAVSVVA